MPLTRFTQGFNFFFNWVNKGSTRIYLVFNSGLTRVKQQFNKTLTSGSECKCIGAIIGTPQEIDWSPVNKILSL